MRFFTDGNFCEVLLVAGVFILFSLHMTMVWDLVNGAGILALSESLCLRKQTTSSERRRGWGFQLHHMAKGPRT